MQKMSTSERYEWYKVVKDNTLQQGDFFYDCPITMPLANPEKEDVEVKVMVYDVVVMSQSCDLEARKVDIVLVCPFFPLSAMKAQGSHFDSSKWLKGVRDGKEPGYHLLNKIPFDGYLQEPFIVEFRNVYGIHLEYLENIARARKDRIRLLPPYKEHLSQSFVRFFMRVGLPIPIEI